MKLEGTHDAMLRCVHLNKLLQYVCMRVFVCMLIYTCVNICKFAPNYMNVYVHMYVCGYIIINLI